MNDESDVQADDEFDRIVTFAQSFGLPEAAIDPLCAEITRLVMEFRNPDSPTQKGTLDAYERVLRRFAHENLRLETALRKAVQGKTADGEALLAKIDLENGL